MPPAFPGLVHGDHDPQPGVSRRRVVVAEDDARMRQLVAELLRKDGFEVEELADGEALFRRVVEAPAPAVVDLVVSDVRLPLHSGVDVLRALRAARRATPVLLMTAFGEASLTVQARELGARLLDKPFTPSALRSAVRELLALAPPG